MTKNKDSWIKLNRNITQWELFGDGNVLKVWIWLLAHTNYEDSTLPDGTEIKAGQVVYSRRKIAKECRMTEREVRTALAKLEASQSMTHISTHSKTVGTLENWGLYQSGPKKTTHKTTQNATTSKNNKEINNKSPEENWKASIGWRRTN